MESELYDLHIQAGRKAGEMKTCGTKNKFSTEEQANKAALSHNAWSKRNHDVEAYPCAYCNLWHVGKIMPIEVLKAMK